MSGRDIVANQHALISSNSRGRGGDAHESGVVGMGPIDCVKLPRGTGPRNRPPGATPPPHARKTFPGSSGYLLFHSPHRRPAKVRFLKKMSGPPGPGKSLRGVARAPTAPPTSTENEVQARVKLRHLQLQAEQN